MSYRYMITFTPLEPFFFGGEYTFGAEESRKEVSRYSATSTQFPQQTALLGMLRKTMLIQNGHLTMHRKGEWVDSAGKGTTDTNYAKAKALVGTESFSYSKPIDLGIIESISPLFIKGKDEYFSPNARDYQYEVKEIDGSMSLGKGSQKVLILDGYDEKTSEYSAFISPSKVLKNYEDFFVAHETVGIKKSYDGKAEEDAFFKKTSYFPKDNACFACIATFSEPLEWTDALVSWGANQSSFKLNIESIAKDYETLFENVYDAKSISRIVLSSETMLSEEAYAMSIFILGKRQVYRQLVDAKNGKKSKRYFLLEKGSVLYTNDPESLSKLVNVMYLNKIGINHHFTIKGKNNV